ncbi:MAG: FtsX-like permease family protein [Actinobacteria bacterium]|nr:FtsX-like permease family protein [Actinomycetota bacterium]MBU2687471.1 FtsX-like permease family protein [Actinomycetota bacterium]
MSQLRKKTIRDLRTHWAQVGAIIVVVALGIIMFSGPLIAQRDLRDSVSDIRGRTLYEDFSAQVALAPATVAGQVGALPNVSAAEGRISRETQGSVKGKKLTVRVVSVPDTGRPTVNGLLVESGRYLSPGQSMACMVEHHLTSEFDLVPGDTVELASGAKLEVSASVVSPEYLRLIRSRSEYVTDPAEFGVVFVHYSEAAGLFGIGGQINEVVARVGDKDRLDETMKAAEHLLSPYTVIGLTSGAEEPGTATLDVEIDDIGRLALFFAVLLLAVASLALYITMTQIVYSQQRQIGVTRAVGYEGRHIVVHYLGYGGLLGVGGSLLGVAVGFILSIVFIYIYAGLFELPLITTSFYPVIGLAGVAVGILFSLLGALVPARHAVRMKPAEAMRVEAGLSLRHYPHHRPPGITERLGFPAWLRISLRNLSRNRRRTILTFLGVIATLCVMVTASGGKDSLDHAVEKYLTGVLRWDAAAGWATPVGPEMLERVKAIPGVTGVEIVMDAPARLTYTDPETGNDYSLDLQVQAYPEDSRMHTGYPTAGSKAYPGPGEVLLNRGVTTRIPVKRGDDVTLSTAVGSLKFTVAGFVSEPFGGVCYVDQHYIQTLLAIAYHQPDLFNAVVVTAAPADLDRVVASLRELPSVAQVLTKNGILAVFQEVLGAVRTLFIIFYVMAFSMGFAVLFSMVTVNLLERGREIATMRTLGTGMGRIFGFVTVETVVVVLAALVPGILLGRLLEWVVVERLVSSDRLAPDTVISWVTIVFIVVASMAVMIISELPSIRRLWHLDLASVTKERAD